jgi:hypothetical protein
MEAASTAPVIDQATGIHLFTEEKDTTTEQNNSQTLLRRRENERKGRERKKANLTAMEERFNSLLKELEYLRTVVQENATALQMLKLYAKRGKTEDTRGPIINTNDIAMSSYMTGGAVYQRSNGYSSSSMFLSGAGELRGARATNTLLSSILSIEEAHTFETNTVSDALERMHVLTMSSEITEDTQEFLQILTQRRYAMPTEVHALEDVDKDDPATVHIFKKERNRLHAKLTRDRKRLVKSKLAQVVQNLEDTIKTLRHGLAEAQVHVPPNNRGDSGMLNMIDNGNMAAAYDDKEEEEKSTAKRVKTG